MIDQSPPTYSPSNGSMSAHQTDNSSNCDVNSSLNSITTKIQTHSHLPNTDLSSSSPTTEGGRGAGGGGGAAAAVASQQSESERLRSRELKIKTENNDYYELCMYHKQLKTIVYDFYLDLPPDLIRSLFMCLFSLNRLMRMLLLYCMYFNTIWWLPNSASNNLAINYTIIDKQVLFILVYINFYELLVNRLLVRLVLFKTLKHLHIMSIQRLKHLLNILELIVHVCIHVHIVYYFKYSSSYTSTQIWLILAPHTFLIIYQQFDIVLVLFGYTLFTNTSHLNASPSTLSSSTNESTYTFVDTQTSSHSSNGREFQQFLKAHAKQTNGSPLTNRDDNSSPNIVFKDHSNLSIASILDQRFALPTLLTVKSKLFGKAPVTTTSSSTINNTVASSASTAHVGIHRHLNTSIQPLSPSTTKLIKQSISKSKTLNRHKSSRLLNRFPFCIFGSFGTWLIRLGSLIALKFTNMVSVARTSRLVFVKRNTFTYVNKYEISSTWSSTIEHKCVREPTGIRAETDYFMHEFTVRFKQVVLKTLESIYFVFVCTRLFVPDYVNMRHNDFAIYMMLATLNTFLTYWFYFMPLSFLLSLERNAHHLGAWRLINVEQKADDKSEAKWLSTRVYFQGERVFHMAHTYECSSSYCVAVPTNKYHGLFYLLFSHSLSLVSMLMLLKIIYLGLLVFLLVGNRRWYVILISIVEIFLNSPLLFAISRDFLIVFLKKPSSVTSSNKQD